MGRLARSVKEGMEERERCNQINTVAGDGWVGGSTFLGTMGILHTRMRSKRKHEGMASVKSVEPMAARSPGVFRVKSAASNDRGVKQRWARSGSSDPVIHSKS